MAVFKIRQTVDLNSSGPQEIKQAHGHVGDKKAHEWEVSVVRGGAPVDLTGYAVMALVNNGVGTVQITGAITGNVASAVFPAACYTEGTHKCFMRISNAGDSCEAITAIMHLSVTAGETDTVIDPGADITTTLSGLLASEAARVGAEEDRVEAEAARAAFYDGFASQLADIATRMPVKSITVPRIATLADTHIAPLSITDWTFPEGITSAVITTCGKNLLNSSTSVSGIKNDAGVDVEDSSFYFDKLIPVIPGETLYINFGAQRVYQYDASKTWIGRTTGHDYATAYGAYIVPSDCYYIQVQYSRFSFGLDNPQIEVGNAGTAFEPYYEEAVTITSESASPVSGLRLHNGTTRIASNVNMSFDIDYAISVADYVDAQLAGDIVIPGCGTYALWEPTTTTNDYTTPLGNANIDLDMTYTQFLALYFDTYLGTTEGHNVKKRSIGVDSSERYEIMEYDFVPKNYNRTILISAGMNPCELSAMWGVAYFIKSVMEDYDDDAGLRYIHDNVRIKVIPCLVPWGFDQSPITYNNYNDVSLNKNFNYNGSWDGMTGYDLAKRGTSPDSEAESRVLKKWLNDNANAAEVWIDCHSDTAGNNTPYLNTIFTSGPLVSAKAMDVVNAINAYYIAKGTIAPDDTHFGGAWTAPLANGYPKTVYAGDVCDIESIMIEQYPNGTYYGSDGTLNNDEYDIKNYVLMIRAYVLRLLYRAQTDYAYNASELAYALHQSTIDIRGKR